MFPLVEDTSLMKNEKSRKTQMENEQDAHLLDLEIS
jgi:hypothetical protein